MKIIKKVSTDLYSELVKFKQCAARKSKNNKNNWVYPNQLQSVQKIINYFLTGVYYVMLEAQMQVGKSGTLCNTAFQILENDKLKKYLRIENVFVATPMNDNDLETQLCTDLLSYTGIDEIDKNNVLKNHDMGELIKPRNEMKERHKQLYDKLKKGNFLLIIDEADRGSNKNMRYDNFCKKFNISVNGNESMLNKNNIFILSVSATNMVQTFTAEEASKKRVILIPDPKSYFGIQKMFALNKIHQSFDLLSEYSIQRFIEKASIKKNSYVLVRARDEKINDVKKYIAKYNLNSKFETMDYFMDLKDDINLYLVNKPKKIKIIFVKGKLRAGKRINTKYVSMAHDTFGTEKASSDVTAQSLLGRCCGNNVNKNILIYCAKVAAESYKNWIDSKYDVNKTPKARHIVGKDENSIKPVFVAKCYIDDCTKFPQLQKMLNIESKSKSIKLEIYRLLANALKNRKKGVIIDPKNKQVIEKFSSMFAVEERLSLASIYIVSSKKDGSSYKKHYADKRSGQSVFSDSKLTLTQDNIGKYIVGGAYDIVKKAFVMSIAEIKVVKTSIGISEKSIYKPVQKK